MVTALQFLQSLLFAVISIALCCAWQQTAASAVVGYGISALICVVGSYPLVRRVWTDGQPIEPAVAAAAGILGQAAAVCRLGLDHEPADEPVRRRRSLHDRALSAAWTSTKPSGKSATTTARD